MTGLTITNIQKFRVTWNDWAGNTQGLADHLCLDIVVIVTQNSEHNNNHLTSPWYSGLDSRGHQLNCKDDFRLWLTGTDWDYCQFIILQKSSLYWQMRAAPVHQELSRPGLIDAEEAISPVAARIFEYSHRAGIEVKPGLIMNYHSHVTSHQVSRYTERALHVTRRHVMLQRRNKTVKWRLTKTKEFWLNINNGDMWRDSPTSKYPASEFRRLGGLCEDVV